MNTKIAVLGDGGWGTTIAILLCQRGYDVTLWGAFPNYIEQLKKDRVNRKFLPGVKIPDKIRLTSNAEEVGKCDLSVVAIPSKYLRETLTGFKDVLKGKQVVSLTKGIEIETLKRPSEVITEILDGRVAVLSGPSISFEVARGLPTTVVVASTDGGLSSDIQVVFTAPHFRVYTSSDIIGVELGGALKNVVAIAAGISDGMGFGVNTKAALLTRGIVEIINLGVKMGARKETFFGLSGIGDLATTCMSTHSRNRWLGEEIGKGHTLKEVLKKTEMSIEGVTTAKSTYELSRRFNVEMPIAEKIYQVLYDNKNPRDAVRELMTRAPKAEAL